MLVNTSLSGKGMGMAYNNTTGKRSPKAPIKSVKKELLNIDQLRIIRFAELDREFARQIKIQASFIKTLVRSSISKNIKPLM